MASFPAQLALVSLTMGGVVLGLYLVGQSSGAHEPGARSTASASSALSTPHAKPPTANAQAEAASARALLSASSWLVVEFDGSLTGSSPFERTQGDCSKVPAPARVGLSIGPGDTGTAEPGGRMTITAGGGVLSLVSPDVSSEFWSCVRAEVLNAGGKAVQGAHGDEVLESPSGILIHHGSRLLFTSDRGLGRELVLLASGAGPSAATTPPHSDLALRLDPEAARSPSHAPLVATLHLPPDWLTDVGPEANQTPLRHLQAGALRADADGGATGTLECTEPGCEELAAFLVRARGDLGARLPAPLGPATLRSWTASHQRLSPTRGLIRLRWVPTEMTFSQWTGSLWRLVASSGAQD